MKCIELPHFFQCGGGEGTQNCCLPSFNCMSFNDKKNLATSFITSKENKILPDLHFLIFPKSVAKQTSFCAKESNKYLKLW